MSVLGAFLINLCVGCFPCTFGNILPYLTSYMRQVRHNMYEIIIILKYYMKSYIRIYLMETWHQSTLSVEHLKDSAI